MYGPAVRCKRVSSSWRWAVLHQCIRPLGGAHCSGPSWKSARLRSHYRTDLIGPCGSPVLAGAGKTDPPSLLILSQTSAGKPVTSAWLRLALNDQAGWVAASTTLPAAKLRPWARTLHAMRASLLASAIASTLRCSRLLAASIQGLSP